jgi:hypothetical protein
LLTAEQVRVLSESIIDCFEKAIVPRFGENVYRVIFANYEIKFGLKKSDVITHSKEFEQLLDDIFGTGLASGLIKRAIFEELANRFPIFAPLYYERLQDKDRVISIAINEILKKAE